MYVHIPPILISIAKLRIVFICCKKVSKKIDADTEFISNNVANKHNQYKFMHYMQTRNATARMGRRISVS